jgi:hypothetical protein
VPFTETFEGGVMPLGWTQERVDPTASNWTIRAGSAVAEIGRTPSAAHGNSLYNACLFASSAKALRMRLVTPSLNLGASTPNTALTFWHCMANYSGYQDKLRVYYRTSDAAEWQELARYEVNVPGWTQRTIALPNPSSTYYIAFEGWGNYGYGVCIDDVMVTGDFSSSPYTVWKNSGFFTSDELKDGLITGDNDDPDNDGIVNGLEYAMALDPRVPDTAGVPFGEVAANYLTLTYRANKMATDVRFEVESSSALVVPDWSTNDVSEIRKVLQGSNSNEWWLVTSQYDVPVTNAPQRFMRLKVWMP